MITSKNKLMHPLVGLTYMIVYHTLGDKTTEYQKEMSSLKIITGE